MNWNSKNEMLKYFKINLPETDVEGIRKKLLKIMSKLHPDKTGGKYTSENHKLEFEEVQEAIAELNKPNIPESSLMIVDKLSDLVAKLSTQAFSNNETQRISEKRELKKEIKNNIKAKFFPIKITSVGLSTMVLGFLSFGKSLAENTYLTPFLSIPYLNEFLFFSLISTVMLFIFTLAKERMEETDKEWLFSEEAKQAILRIVLFYSQRNDKGNYSFSFNEFVNNIVNSRDKNIFRHPNTSRIFFNSNSSRLTIGIAEQIARHHLSDLENRGIIKKSNRKSIEIIYELEKEFEDELHYYLNDN